MSEASPQSSFLTRAEWRVLLILAAVQVTHILDFMIVMPLGPQLMRDLNITPRGFGLVISVYAFSAAISGLVAAYFIDRFDRKTALVGLYAGFMGGTIACALADNYPLLLAARVVAGGFGGVVAALVLAIVGDVFADERRGRATGIVMAGFSLASIGGVPLGLYLAHEFGWRMPFAVLGAVSLAILVLVQTQLPSLTGHLTRGPRESGRVLTVLLMPSHLRAYALMVVLVMGTFMVVPYIATYMVDNVGRVEKELPYVYIFGGLVTLVTMPLIGRIADRYGKLRVFRVLALFAILPTLVITHLPPVSLALSLLVSTVFMAATSGRMVPVMALVMACVVPRYRGSFMSVNASVQQMAMGLASVVGANLLGENADGSLTGFGTVGVLAAVAMLATVWLAGRLQPAAEGEVAADLLAEVAPVLVGID